MSPSGRAIGCESFPFIRIMIRLIIKSKIKFKLCTLPFDFHFLQTLCASVVRCFAFFSCLKRSAPPTSTLQQVFIPLRPISYPLRANVATTYSSKQFLHQRPLSWARVLCAFAVSVFVFPVASVKSVPKFLFLCPPCLPAAGQERIKKDMAQDRKLRVRTQKFIFQLRKSQEQT